MNARHVSKTSSAPSKAGSSSLTARPRSPSSGSAAARASRTPASIGRPPTSGLQATRRPAGRPRAARRCRRRRRVATAGRAASQPAIAPSSSARSSAVRAIGPSTANGSHGAETGQCGTRPGVGRRPSDAAPGRRVAQRAAEVAAVGERHHPAGQRDGGPAARAAGRARRVPGVAGRAEDAVERVRAGAPLGRVGLADEDRARLAQALDLQRVGVRHVLAERGRAVRRAHAGGVLQILVRDRQAVQRRQVLAARTPPVGLVGRRERALGRDA